MIGKLQSVIFSFSKRETRNGRKSKMSNLILNRRKKKNKVPEIDVKPKNESDSSSSYEFSAKLNSKYNRMPEEMKEPKSDKECLLRYRYCDENMSG